MRKILLLALSFFLSISGFAQESTSQKLTERYVYLWDVTISMVGAGTKNPDIYDEIRDMIIDDIKSIPQNDETEIVVVAFRGNLEGRGYKEWREYANNNGKRYLEREMMDFKTSREKDVAKNPDRGNTNTHTALKYVVDHVLSKDKVDYLKIMTDGGCDEKQKFEELISQWCEIKEDKKVFAYYITLTEKAHEYKDLMLKKQRIEQVAKLDCFKFIDNKDAIELVRQLSPRTTENQCYNILEDRGEELKYKFDVSLGDGKLDTGFKIRCRTINDSRNDFFQIDTVIEFDPSHKTITLVPHIDKYAHHNMSSNEEREVALEFTPYEDNAPEFDYVFISDNTQFITLTNSEQTLKLKTNCYECNVRESNSKIKLAFSCDKGNVKPGYKVNYRCEYIDYNNNNLLKAEGTGTLDENLTLTIAPKVSPAAKDPNNVRPGRKHEYANIIVTPANNSSYKNVTFITENEENKCEISLLNKTLRTVKIRYVK